MDSSRCALVVLNLKPNYFDSFKCEKNHAMGLNLASIIKVLKGIAPQPVKLKTSVGADHIAETIQIAYGNATVKARLRLNVCQRSLKKNYQIKRFKSTPRRLMY